MILSHHSRPLVIYGAGDHGQVVAEAAELAGFDVVGFWDDALEPGEVIGQWPVLEPAEKPISHELAFVAIGDNETRRRAADQLTAGGWSLTSVVHPAASISESATAADGVFVGPQAVVHTGASLETGTIINSGAIVEHHGQVGAFTHIAPGVAMGGHCQIGSSVLIGVGARLLPERQIGDGAHIAAGAVVAEHVPEGTTVAGVPARPQ